MFSPKVINFNSNLGIKLLVNNCRRPENGYGCTSARAEVWSEASSSVTAKGGDVA